MSILFETIPLYNSYYRKVTSKMKVHVFYQCMYYLWHQIGRYIFEVDVLFPTAN